MFNRTKMGRFHVMVCGTTPCMLCGARNIYEAIKTHLGVDYGETTQVDDFMESFHHELFKSSLDSKGANTVLLHSISTWQAEPPSKAVSLL